DPNYSPSQLTITVTGLPNDGTVLLGDDVTSVSSGETLTAQQLAGLAFKPSASTFGASSTFTYSVTNPSGLSATGSANLAIGPAPPVSTLTGSLSPDGSTLIVGSTRNLITAAGSWTFSTATTPDGNVILLNGQPLAVGGSAVVLEVANQGNLY